MTIKFCFQIADAAVIAIGNTARSYFGHVDEIDLMETVTTPLIKLIYHISVTVIPIIVGTDINPLAHVFRSPFEMIYSRQTTICSMP